MSATSDNLRETIAGSLANQSAKTVTVLSSLLAIEDELGYIPPEAIEEVASFTKATINDVWGVASFYTNFRFTPPGDHVLEVCWGPTCHLLGARNIMKSILDSLDLTEEGDTEDGTMSLKYSTCLGACSQGPVIHVDGKMIGAQTISKTKGEDLVNKITEFVTNIRKGKS